MAFSEFTYPEVLSTFGLTETTAAMFADAPPVPPSSALLETLPGNLILASLIRTEKARAEWIVAPMLGELWRKFRDRISLFSGIDFPADPDTKLTGYCDFLIGRGVQLPRLVAPLMVVIEAKRDDVSTGYGQCIAGMVGIQKFNQRAEKPATAVFGVVTTGISWQFLRLEGQVLTFDPQEHVIDPPERLYGMLVAMIDTLLATHP